MVLKNLKDYLTSKSELKKQRNALLRANKILQNKLKVKAKNILKKFEELDQNKFYYLYVETSNPDELQAARDLLRDVAESVPWTLPKIIVSNHKLSEIPKSELKKLLKK